MVQPSDNRSDERAAEREVAVTDLPTWDALVEQGARAMLGAHDWTQGEEDIQSGYDALPPDWKAAYKAMAASVLTALSQHIPVREIVEGSKVATPAEPTDVMGEAGHEMSEIVFAATELWQYEKMVYRAMLAKRPKR